MTKVLVLLTKKDGLSRDEFCRYWREVHGPIGERMPGLRRYVQNHVVADGAPYDGVAELWFDSPADMQAAFTSQAAKDAAHDVPNFLAAQEVVVVEELEMTPRP